MFFLSSFLLHSIITRLHSRMNNNYFIYKIMKWKKKRWWAPAVQTQDSQKSRWRVGIYIYVTRFSFYIWSLILHSSFFICLVAFYGYLWIFYLYFLFVVYCQI